MFLKEIVEKIFSPRSAPEPMKIVHINTRELSELERLRLQHFSFWEIADTICNIDADALEIIGERPLINSMAEQYKATILLDSLNQEIKRNEQPQ